jgi:hypothetical protein
MNHVRLVLDDRRKNKLYDFDIKNLVCKIKTKNEVFNVKTDADILVHHLAFNTTRGSFLKKLLLKESFFFYLTRLKAIEI